MGILLVTLTIAIIGPTTTLGSSGGIGVCSIHTSTPSHQAYMVVVLTPLYHCYGHGGWAIATPPMILGRSDGGRLGEGWGEGAPVFTAASCSPLVLGMMGCWRGGVVIIVVILMTTIV